jgi:hypothetical protein
MVSCVAPVTTSDLAALPCCQEATQALQTRLSLLEAAGSTHISTAGSGTSTALEQLVAGVLNESSVPPPPTSTRALARGLPAAGMAPASEQHASGTSQVCQREHSGVRGMELCWITLPVLNCP